MDKRLRYFEEHLQNKKTTASVTLKPSILLDIDNTALVYQKDGSAQEHPRLQELIKKYRVILYSAREDVEFFAKQWNVPYIWKGYDDLFPEADFLVDDQYEEYLPLVTVKKSYSSINTFFAAQKK